MNKQDLYDWFLYMVYGIGAVCCLAVSVGLYYEHLYEPNLFIRWAEIFICLFASFGLFVVVIIQFTIIITRYIAYIRLIRGTNYEQND